MNPDEVDRCAGLYFHQDGSKFEGDLTNAPEATEGDRLAAIGNSIMIPSYLFLFSFLPQLTRGDPRSAPASSVPHSSPSPRAGPGDQERGGARRRVDAGEASSTSSFRPAAPVPLPFDPDLLQHLIPPLEDLEIGDDNPRIDAAGIDRFSRAVADPPDRMDFDGNSA